jgi:alkanesulfonate monooxygenase SsuD/methylene tetrahydromethanopterin reductase-like flavin-dependent oxidoreductase (luciferase family)
VISAFTLLFHLHHESESERSSRRAYAEVLGLVRQADGLPFERAWFAEHHLRATRGRIPSPLLFCVAAAGETRRIGLGPCVMLLPLHHPVDVAEQAATADLLCEGRLAVGVGSGGNAEEFAAYGVGLEERRERYAEALAAFCGLWREPTYGHAGTYYSFPAVTLMPPPATPLGELLWVAASSTQSSTLAGRSGGNLLLARGVSLADLRDQIEVYRDARREAGHAGAFSVQVTRGVYVAETEAAAWRDAEEGIRRHYRQLARYGGEEVELREMARRGDFIVGTPEQCVEQIADLFGRVPITHLACDIALIGAPVEMISRSLQLLGREVIQKVGRPVNPL